MKITKETIEHVANLARLNLSEQEKEKLTLEMASIISYVDKLNELDTEGIQPTSHVLPVQNVFREDICSQSFDRDTILSNAPSSEDGCFKVPKVVE
ncbi:aspartyl/glutamyl-tRNA(Asn/Gln) amidotransferase subunit C [Anaerobacterium chartisolvens]|uniref:Aspartyl/glutamyl-tRNA(Asn/Gln) amidotransferase subunit C n=1 Tax=Anaerobacterium chartisolvens TaxID=1297424 RepID=A0A369B7L0_9FIRM|nr:Asp-tRNA(Asn)/Glu-tRNA(Gln) amidotransferase subunit GatC [Anaerobacterium chartisolvens]RCX16588.1 aspartyl/glutamyl-tRNA(Asn/Gln) amidotransferase subunit C [Anaerobacterium chartisolvens]